LAARLRFRCVADSLRAQQTLDRVLEQAPKLRKRAATYVVPLIYDTSHGDMHSEKDLALNLQEALMLFLVGLRINGRNVMVVGHNDGFQALASLLRRVVFPDPGAPQLYCCLGRRSFAPVLF
jgi:phosphohistidine phosphatase SixA